MSLRGNLSVEILCANCENLAVFWLKHQKYKYKKNGLAYCGPICAKEYRRKISSETMAKTNRVHASDRMKKNNPMANPESKAKAWQTLKDMGHKPPIRGGNGTGATKPQALLAQFLVGLVPRVIVEHVQPTRAARGQGLPTHYKIDIALPVNMLAIEVDGNSHCLLSRQAQDRKKVAFLNTLGWTVLRFSNKEVMERSKDCVQTVLSTISRLRETTTTSLEIF